MIFRLIINISLVSVFVTASNKTEIFKICSRDDPELNDCLKDAIQHALGTLKDGYNKSGLIMSSLDPYFQDEMTLEYKRNQLYATFNLKNLLIYGISSSTVNVVRANIEDDKMDIEIEISNSKIYVKASYTGVGKINAITLNTKGFMQNNLTDVSWLWKITGKPELKNGKKYIKVKQFYVDPEIGDMDINIPALFRDNPEFNRFVLNFIKLNWKSIYYELLPIIRQIWGKIGVRVSNRVFRKIPYDELFPCDL